MSAGPRRRRQPRREPQREATVRQTRTARRRAGLQRKERRDARALVRRSARDVPEQARVVDDDPDADLPDLWELDFADPDETGDGEHRDVTADDVATDDSEEQPLPPLADIDMWLSGAAVEYEVVATVRLAEHGLLDDPDHLAWVTFLEALAACLVEHQGRALAVTTRAEAFERLAPMTGRQLAEHMGYADSDLSRRGDVLVATLHWTVPARFFASKNREQQQQADRLRRVADELARDPQAPAAEIGRRLAREIRFAERTIRDDVGQLKRLRENGEIVRRHRARYPYLPWQDLRDEAGLEQQRGELVAKLVLIDAIDIGIGGG